MVKTRPNGLSESEYQHVHYLVRKHRGKAASFMCTDCEDCASEWSLTLGGSPMDVDDYEPRCRSCHAKYDCKGNTGMHMRRDTWPINMSINEIEKLRGQSGGQG